MTVINEFELKAFKNYISKQLKLSRDLFVGLLELKANEKANIDFICNLFESRLENVIKLKIFRIYQYNYDGNIHVRLYIVTKSSAYSVITEKMRYSGNDQLPLTIEISSIWSKILFDHKSFPFDTTETNNFLNVDILNGVELHALKIDSIVKHLSSRVILNKYDLEKRIKEIKHISIKLLSSLEFNKNIYPSSYTINIPNRFNINKFKNFLKGELKEIGVKYYHITLDARSVKQKLIIFLFENDILMERRYLFEKYFEKENEIISLHYGNMNGLIDPREYSNVKLQAESMLECGQKGDL